MSDQPITPIEPAEEYGDDFDSGKRLSVGSFRHLFAEDRWEWSDELYHLFGYRPGEVQPSAELLRRHQHRSDRGDIVEDLVSGLETGRTFSVFHRVVPRGGGLRSLVIVADRLLGEWDSVAGIIGYCVDLTDLIAGQRDEFFTSALTEVLRGRSAIEQAKGVLMGLFRLDADRAFGLLRWRSQETNVKVRDIAGQLLAELHTLPPISQELRRHVEHLVLTVHDRIPRR